MFFRCQNCESLFDVWSHLLVTGKLAKTWFPILPPPRKSPNVQKGFNGFWLLQLRVIGQTGRWKHICRVKCRVKASSFPITCGNVTGSSSNNRYVLTNGETKIFHSLTHEENIKNNSNPEPKSNFRGWTMSGRLLHFFNLSNLYLFLHFVKTILWLIYFLYSHLLANLAEFLRLWLQIKSLANYPKIYVNIETRWVQNICPGFVA